MRARVPAAQASSGGRNVLVLRTGITFALLASVVSVHLQEPELFLAEGFKFFYAAVVLSYGWLLLRFAIWGAGEPSLPVSMLQAVVDVAFVSIILFGSLERFFKGAMVWAVFSAITYATMAYLQMRGALVPPGSEEVHLAW